MIWKPDAMEELHQVWCNITKEVYYSTYHYEGVATRVWCYVSMSVGVDGCTHGTVRRTNLCEVRRTNLCSYSG